MTHLIDALCQLFFIQPNQDRSVKCSQADDRFFSAVEPAGAKH